MRLIFNLPRNYRVFAGISASLPDIGYLMFDLGKYFPANNIDKFSDRSFLKILIFSTDNGRFSAGGAIVHILSIFL